MPDDPNHMPGDPVDPAHADPHAFPILPIGDVVHDIGDAVRRQADKLRDAYRRKRVSRMLELGLVVLVGYLVLFRRD